MKILSVAILAISTMTASLGAQELLVNGDFLDVGTNTFYPATTHYWSASSHDIRAVSPYFWPDYYWNEFNVIEHSLTNLADMDSGGAQGWLEQTFTLHELSDVTASGWFVSYPDTAEIAVRGILAENAVAILDMADNVLAMTGLTNSAFAVWEQAVVTTTLAAGTYKYRVYLADSSGNDTNSVTAATSSIPEPSGALLVGLAGLIGMARRVRR